MHIMIDVVISFMCGAVVTVMTLLIIAGFWFYSLPTVVRSDDTITTRRYIHPLFPDHKENSSTPASEIPKDETCMWFNLIVDFLFRELRDTPKMKRLVMKKVEKEFQELLFTKTEGRMLEQLTVREYFLGTSMPVIKGAEVIKVDYSTDGAMNLEEIEIALQVEYAGNCEIAIDADLLFNKAAYVAIQVRQVKGRGRLQFSRQPVSSWSFSFYEEPYLDLKVESHFEGRDFPQLSSFIEAQCRKYVRRKHTLPASKIRYKPFFKKPKPQDQVLDLYVHNDRLTVGKLLIEVVKCSRLPNFDGASMVYCSVGVAATPWKPVIHLWKTQWPVLEFVIDKSQEQTIGMRNRKEVYEDEEESCVLILVSDIIPNSPACAAGVRKGDVVTRVNNVRVNSVKQVTRLINKTKGKSVLITINRPPIHFSTKLLHSESKQHTPIAYATSDATPNMTSTAGNTTPDESKEKSCETLVGSMMRHNQDDGEYGQHGEKIASEVSSVDQCGTGQLLKKECQLADDEDNDITPRGSINASVSTGLLESTDYCPSALDDDCGAVPQSPVIDSQLTTRTVPACKNPIWMQELSFDVGECHNYLNICVWMKLTEERGNLLIGHVTLSLTDVVLECLCTSSGIHHQNYMLVAAEAAKAYASRIATTGITSRSSAGRDDGSTFTGDVFLRLKHIPSCEISCVNKDYQDEKDESGDRHHQWLHHPFTPSQRSMPSDHVFIGVEMDGLHRKCDVCNKKIWVLKSKVQECQKCSIKCHKKCISYCMKNMPCCKKSVGILHQRSEGEFAIYECDRDVGGSNGHRHLQQDKEQCVNNGESLSFEIIRNPDNKTDEESEDSEELINSPADEKVSVSSDSLSESGNDQFEIVDKNMSWYPHLQQRERSLKEKISSLQQEIERIDELIEKARSHERPDSSSSERERIQDEVSQHEEKLHPLKLLMVQLIVELNDCSSEDTVTELSSQYLN